MTLKKFNTLLNVITLIFLLSLLSCNHFEKNLSHRQTPDANIARGKKLAAVYCQSCHLLPDPSLLDSKNWENGVLPGMGPRLGIFNLGSKEYPSSRYDKELDSNYYPHYPVLPFQDWQYIIDYYTALSPDSLPAQERKYPVINTTDLFTIQQPLHKRSAPATCLVKLDTTFSPSQLIIADAISKYIFRYNTSLSAADSVQTSSAVVDITVKKQALLTCNIGNMAPNNGKHGSAGMIHLGQAGGMTLDTTPLFKQLARPVKLSEADFNQDGRIDYLVCEYGNLTGALSWMENKGNGNYERHVIRAVPGAIKAYINDANHDGLPDIWALFAQGDEGVFLFTNKGQGKFEQQEILRFQPIFGSSYFEFADFNKDGLPDILYTCGDNADYSPVIKPYHGVYIFMNEGNNRFKQSYFFAMHGCFKAVARDFDKDGNLDIAAISFFGDYVHQPEQTFIYLGNKGNLDFQPYSVPGTSAGRWLTMDAGDIDGDGSTDIILGNFSLAPASVPAAEIWRTGPPFIVLKNIIKTHK